MVRVHVTRDGCIVQSLTKERDNVICGKTRHDKDDYESGILLPMVDLPLIWVGMHLGLQMETESKIGIRSSTFSKSSQTYKPIFWGT